MLTFFTYQVYNAVSLLIAENTCSLIFFINPKPGSFLVCFLWVFNILYIDLFIYYHQMHVVAFLGPFIYRDQTD